MENLAVDRAIRKINEEFNDDVKSLHKAKDLLKAVSKETAKLEGKLNFASCEVPGQLETAVSEAQKCTANVSRFKSAQEELSGDVSNHRADVSDVIKGLTSLKGQIEELEKYSSYLKCVNEIEDLSSDIQSALIIGAVERAVSQFSLLAELTEVLQASQCKNLVQFANQTLLFWHKILKDRLASEFEQILLAWRWPFIVTSVKPKPVASTGTYSLSELKEKLPPVFTSLLALKLPMSLSGEQTSGHPVLSDTELRPPLLPIQLMLKPLSKRFRFHFYGNKQTNSLDKPEWYMTQILTWLRDHREFMDSRIQPILDRASLKYVHAMVEFSRGLILLVMEKMLSDLPHILYDDAMFCHFVDEILSFYAELVEVYEYPASQPNCLKVLTEQQCFHKWLLIEKKFAMEKMDAMLSDVKAWQSQYADVGQDIDELKVPQCGESFVTLVSTMTDRYRSLPTPSHRCQFLNLQLEILEEYRVRLAQVKNAEAHSPLSRNYVAILNTVSYVLEVLRDWCDLPFFMELHLYRQQSEDDSMYSAVDEQDSTQNTTHDTSVLSTNISAELTGANLESLEGTVFDQLINLYDHFRKELLGNLIKYVYDDVTARSRPYRNDKWLALPSQKAFISLALSTSACEMFMVLKDHLHHVQLLLSKPLFELTWVQLATRLNIFIYNEVILENRFNEGGAAQLQHDMLRNLFPLFAQYTPKPENYFKDVKEACMLLNLPSGSAKLTSEVLDQALRVSKSDPNDQPMDPIATMHELGVYKLSLEDCQVVLSLRTDL